MGDRQYTVRASHCDHRASEEEIYEVLKRTTDPLDQSWKKLEKARRIVLKFNMIKPPERIEYFAGRRRELVDDAVARAVLRLLRERTTAELIATDTYPYGNGHVTPDDFNYRYILDDFGVRYVDSNLPPFATYDVPGGGCMFDRYLLNAIFAEADEVVSIAKMKNHAFMGITLTLKNLFGLPPMIPPEGRTRSYYHHLIRLSYVLPDLGMKALPQHRRGPHRPMGPRMGRRGPDLQCLDGRRSSGGDRCLRHDLDGPRSSLRLADPAFPPRPQSPADSCRARLWHSGFERDRLCQRGRGSVGRV